MVCRACSLLGGRVWRSKKSCDISSTIRLLLEANKSAQLIWLWLLWQWQVTVSSLLPCKYGEGSLKMRVCHGNILGKWTLSAPCVLADNLIGNDWSAGTHWGNPLSFHMTTHHMFEAAFRCPLLCAFSRTTVFQLLQAYFIDMIFSFCIIWLPFSECALIPL